MTKNIETVPIGDVAVGDRVRFIPGSRESAWWTTTARNDEHVVAVRQAAFHPKGIVEYTITGHLESSYNGQGPGVVRSSLNTLGGGWDLEGRIDEGSQEILDELSEGRFELSMRRVAGVARIDREVR
ncbi:hypothetical protein QWJ90_01415 [Microbacterium oryzae]|uniref:hypothetical protein n=1 Tax=Microbacterium oryzae TaxID=743009 RepID=UPI0025B0423F|nr:hypothetical protein [Microbacterium oryzae]MDN3309581.1 hypothetical protein [Microbacterium oryzae]